MVKSFLSTLLFLCISFYLCAQASNEVWTRLEVDIPLSVNYQSMVELCGDLFVSPGGSTIYRSEDSGETWMGLETPPAPLNPWSSSKAILRNNGLAFIVSDMTPNSGDSYIGTDYVYGYDCDTETFLLRHTSEAYRYWHSCSYDISLGYSHGLFTRYYSNECYQTGLQLCELYSSEDALDYDFEVYSNDDAPSCANSLEEYFNGIYQNVYNGQGPSGFLYFASKIGNSEPEPLFDAVGAVYIGNHFYYSTGGDTIYTKSLSDTLWTGESVGIADIVAMGEQNGGLFAANDSMIFTCSAPQTELLFSPVINVFDATGETIERVDFFQNIYFVGLSTGVVVRFSETGEMLDNALLGVDRVAVSDIYSSGKHVYFESYSFSNTQKIISADSVVAVSDPYTNLEDPFIYEEYDDYSVAITKTVNANSNNVYTVYKSIDGINWDSLTAIQEYEIRYFRRGNHLNVLSTAKRLYQSSNNGTTWDLTNLPNSYRIYDNFDMDDSGTWIGAIDSASGITDSIIYSTDNGLNWTFTGDTTLYRKRIWKASSIVRKCYGCSLHNYLNGFLGVHSSTGLK